METRNILASTYECEATRATLKFGRKSSSDEIQLIVRLEIRGNKYEAEGENYFDVLASVRRQLEELGILIKCYGAGRNVYPSPMIQSMGDGRKAYRLTIGKQALEKDLVDIFDSPDGEDFEFATVEEQEDFYMQWISSL